MQPVSSMTTPHMFHQIYVPLASGLYCFQKAYVLFLSGAKSVICRVRLVGISAYLQKVAAVEIKEKTYCRGVLSNCPD